jgi:hypothetical protein
MKAKTKIIQIRTGKTCSLFLLGHAKLKYRYLLLRFFNNKTKNFRHNLKHSFLEKKTWYVIFNQVHTCISSLKFPSLSLGGWQQRDTSLTRASLSASVSPP